MSPETGKSGLIADRMKQAVAAGVFPGAVLLVWKQGKIVFHKAYGRTDLQSEQAVTLKTVFDLASLTKPLATALSILKLEGLRKLSRDQGIGEILDEFRSGEKEKITIRHLLNHTAGLPAYQPYFETLRSLPREERKNAVHKMIAAEPLIHPVGAKTLYSDIGFMLLNWIIEVVSQERLDRFVTSAVYQPLGIAELFFIDRHDGGFKKKQARWAFAATENCPWRGKTIVGEVHDDNAYVLGGIEGHAGLFGTARGVNLLLSALQDIYHGHLNPGVLQSEILRQYLHVPQPGLRGLGFDTPDPEKSSCGQYFSKETVGHLGFTGTSFWMDLRRRIHVVLLSNRVHPSRENVRIRAFRPLLHDTVMKNI